jgi:S1-C subfamily serine protease
MLKKIRNLSIGVACAALIFLSTAIQPQLHNSYLRWEVGESVVQVLSPRGGGGTGFAIKAASGEDFIVTNKHVCESGINGWVIIKSQKSNESTYRRILYKDRKHDLCLIQGDKRLSPLELGSEPDRGDFTYIVGHPGLRQLTVSQGEYIGYSTVQLIEPVEQRNQCNGKIYELTEFQQIMYGLEFICVKTYNAFATTAVVYPGNSGSPAVDKFGNVIGVLFAGSNKEERDNYIVPLSYLKNMLNKF